MNRQFAGIKLGKTALLVAAGLVLALFAIEFYADRQGLSYKEVIVALALLVGGVVMFGGERGIRLGLVLWVLSLALGYRTVEWTPNLRIHPSEILLWVLLICVCAQRQFQTATRFSLPWWVWMMVPFCVLGWWPLIAGDAPWDKMFNEFRDFLLLIPLLIVASAVLEQKSYWRHLWLAFFVASTWIALLGVIEYGFPSVERLFPAFIHAAKPEVTAEGFARAQFSFWGGSQATFICVLALPGAIYLANWFRGWLPRLAIVISVLLQMMAIYVGGYRSIWLVLLLQVLAAFVIRVKKYGVVLAVVVLFVALGGYQFIPKTNERLTTGFSALQGNPIDHSAQDRKLRAIDAINDSLDTPFGKGWSGAGWVHSDFLQVAANLGIIAGLVFLGGFIYTMMRLCRQLPASLRGGDGDLGLTLVLSFIAVGGLLLMQGVQVLPQMMLPVWFVWSLVENWLRQTSEARQLSYTYAPANFYPAADFQ
jgi:hypothetical protein